LCYSEARLVNKNNKKISYIGIPADFSIASNNPAGSALKELLVNRRCFIVNSTVIYRKDNLLKIGGFTEAKGIAQDYPTWIKLSLEGHFTPVYKCLGYYRKHPSSLTQNVDAEAWFEDETNFLQQFISENSKRLEILGIKYDKKILSEAWQKTKLYIPYNQTMYMLMSGMFDEARERFKIFLKRLPTNKHRLIYIMLIFSDLLKLDIVNPAANLKNWIKKVRIGQFRGHHT